MRGSKKPKSPWNSRYHGNVDAEESETHLFSDDLFQNNTGIEGVCSDGL